MAVFQNNLGMALERTGHFRAAEAAYAQALAISEAYERAEVNRARVEGLEERPDLEPLDLAELARSFVDEIQSWREAVVGISEPEAAVEPIAVVEADTIPGPERR